MSEKAFQRIYTKLSAITKATVTLEAQGVTNDELAFVAGRLAQVYTYCDDKTRRRSQYNRTFEKIRS